MQTLKKSGIFTIYFLIITSLLAQDADKKEIITTEPDEVVELMNSHFQSYKTMRCDFREYFRGNIRRGKIRYRKPHFLKVLYLRADGSTSMEIYADEKKLFVYMKNMNVVCEQELLKTGDDEEIFDSSMVNLERLIKNYNFNFKKSREPVPVLTERDMERFELNLKDDSLAYHFELTPRDVTMGLEDMELWITTNGLITRTRTTTLEKKILDIWFYNIEKDVNISTREFLFEVPANARIIKNNLMDINDLEDEED